VAYALTDVWLVRPSAAANNALTKAINLEGAMTDVVGLFSLYLLLMHDGGIASCLTYEVSLETD
jgi:hypothetical protein